MFITLKPQVKAESLIILLLCLSLKLLLVGSGTEAPYIQALGFSRPSITDNFRISRGGIELTVRIGGIDGGDTHD